MKFTEYLQYAKDIAEGSIITKPYDDLHFREYTRLNLSRMYRWLKTGVLEEALKSTIHNIITKQTWIVITEPWCGDAAQSVPFIQLLAEQNPLINVSYELRDSPPHRIEKYLTMGSKAIPVLIVKNERGDDMFIWRSRPQEAEDLRKQMIREEIDNEDIRSALQKWYNQNKGRAIQSELQKLFNNHR